MDFIPKREISFCFNLLPLIICFFVGNVILFIDEVHTIVGSGTVGRGNKGSGLDIANLLKPSLGRGEFQVIF